MPDGVEQIGVEAKAEGVAKFLRDMQACERAYDSFTARTGQGSTQTATAAKSAESAMTGLNSAGKVLTNTAGGLATGIGSVAAAIGTGGTVALVAVVGAAIVGIFAFIKALKATREAIEALIQATTEFAQEGLMLAGRFQEMEIAALAVGRSMDLTEDEIRGAIKDINELGIRYDIAAKTVTQFSRNQIDLKNSTDLVRIAQGAAVIAQEDSSEAMEHLVWAITTQNTRMLRTLGIMTDLKQAEEDYAKAQGKKVEQLTESEQMQARVNAVIRDGANLLDVYKAAMESPTKALRSLANRVIPELQATMMQFFLPAWVTVIKAVTNFATALKEAMQEGGSLYPVLIRLGAAVALLADAFSAALDWVSQFVRDLDLELGRGFEQTVENMFRWGAEIVAALAEGMVSAAHQAMQVMADTISSLMSFWFGPGSDPKIAPFSVWGADYIAQLLHGMTKGDFSILKTVQSAMGAFLSPKALGKLSKGLIGDISAGGVGESFFERIARTAGIFGKEVTDLARKENALAEATKAMDDANRKYEASQVKVSRLIMEYNDMLRAGASEQELAAKLAEVRAAEEEKAAAATTKQQAAVDVSTLQEQVDLQKALVDQLAALYKMQTKETAKVGGNVARAIKGIGKEIGGLVEGLGPGGKWDITSKIGEAIDRMKALLKERLADIFQPLVDAWNNIYGMIFGYGAGYTVEGAPAPGIVDFVNQIIGEFERLREKASEKFTEISTTINTWVNNVMQWFTVVVPGYFSFLIDEMIKAGGLIPTWEILRDVIGAPKESVYEAITRLGNYVTDTFLESVIGKWVKSMTKKNGLIDALGKVADLLEKHIAEALITIARAIIEARKEWQRFVSAFDEGAASAMPFTGQSPSPLERGLVGITKALPALRAEMMKTFPTPSMALGGMGPAAAGGGTSNYTTMHQTSYSVNAPIGPVSINNGMDWVQFENRVEKVLRRSLGGTV